MYARSIAAVAALLCVANVVTDAAHAPDTYAARLRGIGAELQFDSQGRITALGVGGAEVEDKDLDPGQLEHLTALALGGDNPFAKHRPGKCRLTDAALLSIENSKQMSRLSLHGDGFTDRSIAVIRRLAMLRSLRLVETRVTDNGLAQVPCVNYEYLDLTGTKITGKGLSCLASCRKLSTLVLERTLLDDEGARHLSALKSLRELNLKDTRVTDQALKRLSGLTGLVRLELDGTNITDSGASWLEPMKALEYLSVKNTQLTDFAIPSLGKLQQLEFLDVEGTRVSPAGAERLEQSLPAVNVYGLPDPHEWMDRG